MIHTTEKRYATIGTAIFAVLLLLVLLFSVLRLAPPPQEMEGIPVMFGTMDAAGGFVEPPRTEVTPQPAQPTPTIPQPTVDEPLIAQITEPTIDVQAQREEEQRRREQAVEAARRQEEERQRAAEEARRRQEEAQRQQIADAVSGLFGEQQGSRGETEGAGTQGVTTGSDTQGIPQGMGGVGSFDLAERYVGAGGLVRPRFEVNDQGVVVVDITVAPDGRVIYARAGARGTTTPNAALRRAAEEAALATRFNPITGTNNQRGTILYNFRLN